MRRPSGRRVEPQEARTTTEGGSSRADSTPAQQVVAQGLPRSDRMRRRREFLAVQREGWRVHTRHFIVVLRASAHQRIGVTVTKKVANAVGRNRVKRLVREVFRRNRGLFPAKSDVVMVARPGAEGLDYARLVAELEAAQPALRDAERRGERPRRPPRPRLRPGSDRSREDEASSKHSARRKETRP